MSNRGRPRIEIESFGPIVSGSFELRPLTLFLGRDNTGKSCAAALAHSIVRAVRNGVLSPRALEEGAGSPTAQELADRLFSSEGLQEAVLGQLWRSFSSEDLSGLISWFSAEGKACVRLCPPGSEDCRNPKAIRSGVGLLRLAPDGKFEWVRPLQRDRKSATYDVEPGSTFW